MPFIDQSWYTRPPGLPTRVASGGLVVRAAADQLYLALTREEDMDGFVLPKGGVEVGEDLLQAAQREIHEETGLSQLTLLKKLAVTERLTYDKSRWAEIHFYLFYTEQIDGIPADSEHHYAMYWFTFDDLPRFLWPEQRALVKQHQADIRRQVRTLLDDTKET